MKTTAATSRHRAPRVSSTTGTEADGSRPLGAGRAPGWAAAPGTAAAGGRAGGRAGRGCRLPSSRPGGRRRRAAAPPARSAAIIAVHSCAASGPSRCSPHAGAGGRGVEGRAAVGADGGVDESAHAPIVARGGPRRASGSRLTPAEYAYSAVGRAAHRVGSVQSPSGARRCRGARPPAGGAAISMPSWSKRALIRSRISRATGPLLHRRGLQGHPDDDAVGAEVLHAPDLGLLDDDVLVVLVLPQAVRDLGEHLA